MNTVMIIPITCQTINISDGRLFNMDNKVAMGLYVAIDTKIQCIQLCINQCKNNQL